MEGIEGDIVVRTLTASDVDRLVAMDTSITGRQRKQWYQGVLQRVMVESDLRISLGAEVEQRLVGAVLGSLQFGEFGIPEPVAVLDTILVDPSFSGRGVGRELMAQLVRNLKGLRVTSLRTQVGWDEQRLIGFLAHAGFAPVPRLVLEMPLQEP